MIIGSNGERRRCLQIEWGQALAFDGGARLVVSLAVDTVAYGCLTQGYRMPRRFTLSNTGTESVSGVVELIGASVADENDWQLEQGGSVVADGTSLDLAAGESTTLDVVLTPQAIGETAAALRYVHGNGVTPTPN